jgi:hypothetical protein
MQRNENNYSVTLLIKLISSAFSILVLHPFRVCINVASVTTNLVETMVEARKTWKDNVPLNMARGTLAVFVPSVINHYVNEYCGYTTSGKFLATVCAGVGGIGVTPIDAYFMRKNYQSTSKFFYNKHMLKFFGVRDIVFSLGVFGTGHLSDGAKMSVMLPIAVLSAAGHKLAYTEATKDLRGIADQVPNYDRGYRAAFKDMAYGRIKHKAFKVYFQNPDTYSKLAINTFSATCGLNIFFWRLVYLTSMTYVLHKTNQQTEHWAKQLGLFKDSTVSELTETTENNSSSTMKNKK